MRVQRSTTMQVLARPLRLIGFGCCKFHDVDDEAIALPAVARAGRHTTGGLKPADAELPSIDDVALPTLSLAHVVEDRYAARGSLHDPPEADATELRHPAGQAALRQRGVLKDHNGDSCARCCSLAGAPRSAWRLRGIVLAASCTPISLFLPRLGRLQQGDAKCRSAAPSFWASAVSGGTRPSGGSTIRDVPRAVALHGRERCDLARSATSASVPRSTRFSQADHGRIALPAEVGPLLNGRRIRSNLRPGGAARRSSGSRRSDAFAGRVRPTAFSSARAGARWRKPPEPGPPPV